MSVVADDVSQLIALLTKTRNPTTKHTNWFLQYAHNAQKEKH